MREPEMNGCAAPHVKHIKEKLWELRIKSASDISRIFYFVHTGKDLVLLHGFIKKTQKTPSKEIQTANKYLEDYQSIPVIRENGL